MNARDKGLTVIFTGNGKGKTSAALGVVCRTIGHGYKSKVIQFIKGKMNTGELHLVDKLGSDFDIEQVGKGFTWRKSVSKDDHAAAAAQGVKAARKALGSGQFKTVVLDEILYALRAQLVTIEQIEELIKTKEKHVHLVLTGRDAPQRLIDRADMVTSMEMVKHPSAEGIPAQKCLDY